MVIGDIVRRNARRFPDKVAIVFEENRLTWREVNERVNRFSHSLLKLGLKKGERVVIFSKNSHQFIEILFALAKTGLIGITPNYRLSEKELTYIINDSEASAAIVSDECIGSIKENLSKIQSVRYLIGIGNNHLLPLDFEEMVKDGIETEPAVTVNENDIRLLMYTSGTTGVPKGAVWRHKEFFDSCWYFIIAAHIEVDDTNLNVLPLCLAGGSQTSMTFAMRGCTNVILKEFDPRQIFETVEKEHITITTLVPTMIINLISHPDVNSYNLSTLKKINYGSAPISIEVLKQALEKFRCNFIQTYGATETGVFCSYLLFEDHILNGSELKTQRLASVGREAMWAEILIVDEAGNEVPVGEVGEILIKGDGVIKEYWKSPEKTKESIRNGGWYSGDIAKRDEDGYIYIVDRKIQMISSGGIKIYPREIENVLYSHPSVKEAVVIGVPDPEWGEAVKAVIILKEGMKATEEEIISFCKEHLASYKKPKSVDFVGQFPLGTGGKILKRVIREQYWKGRDRRV
jgi:long-chain acyl-CoA synthetase